MSYATPAPASRKHLLGFAFVVALHLVLAYALMNGLGHQVVNVLKAPLTVSLIEEVRPLPLPPPPPKALPKPKTPAAPAPFVPPVEVAVQAPPQNAVTTSNTPAPQVPPAPVAPASPPSVSAAVACPNFEDVRSRVPYPPQAERMGLSGDVVVEFVVGAGGEVKDIAVARTTNSMFNAAATGAVGRFRCVGQGHDVRVRVPFSFRQG